VCEIGKLARKHRNRYSLQLVYEIVRYMVNRRDAMVTKTKRDRMKEEKRRKKQ
jgi:hypothetical protein